MDIIYQYISEELIHSLGWTVIHSLWQAMLIAIVMALVMIPLQNRSARLRYEVGGLSLLMVLLSAIVTFTLLYDQALSAPAETIILTELSAGSAGDQLATAGLGFIEQWAAYFDQHIPLIVTLWILGALFFLLRLLGGFAYVQHLKHNRNQPISAYWQRKLRELSQRIPIRKTVQLLESSLVKVPMVIGSLKPVILLPMGAVNNLSEQEVEAILAHELAHIRRNDYLINLCLSVIEVLFYYHPAVWWIAANIRVERENCCDDIAVELCGNSLTYAKALVRLQDVHHSAPAFAMSFSGRKQHLLNRIKRILNQPQSSSNIMEKLTATTFLLLAILFLSVSAGPGTETETSIDHSNTQEPITTVIVKEEPQTTVFVNRINADTLPPAKGTSSDRKKMILHKDGQRVEMLTENGELKRLKIDETEIPVENYEAYSDLIEDVRAEMENIPTPPPPPPAPPAPPAPLFESAPTPPTPPSPPAAPRFRQLKQRQKTVTTTQQGDGNTIIVIESNDGEEPMEIIVDADQEVVFIDGNKLASGDTAIIIDDINIDIPHFKYHFDSRDGVDQHMPFHYSMPDNNIFLQHKDGIFQFDDEKLNEWIDKHQADAHLFQLESEKFLDEDGNFDWRAYTKEMEGHNKQLFNKLEDDKKTLKRHREHLGHLKHLEHLEKRQKEQLKRQLDRAKHLKKRNELRHQNIQKHYDHIWKKSKHVKVSEKLELELLRDGLIEDADDYSMELSNKKFRINGKKQSKSLHQRYMDLYLALTGMDEESSFNIHINK